MNIRAERGMSRNILNPFTRRDVVRMKRDMDALFRRKSEDSSGHETGLINDMNRVCGELERELKEILLTPRGQNGSNSSVRR